MNNIKNSSVKAMTLFETMITICVTALLFVSLATSFYTFRVLNTSTINNSKKELSMMAIKGYVEANTDRIVSNKIGGICMYVDVDQIKDEDYSLYLYNKFYFIVPNSDVSSFLAGTSGCGDKVMDLQDIALYKNDGNGNRIPIINLNGDYIIKLDVTEFYNGMQFVFYDNKEDVEQETDKYAPVRMFNDFGRDFYDNIGESLYYYYLDNNESFDGLFDGLFDYREMNDGKKKTNCLYINLNGGKVGGEPIFDNLYYDNLTIDYSIKTETFSVAESLSSRNIKPVVAVQEGDKLVKYDNYKYGIVYVSETNSSISQATLSARELLFSGHEFNLVQDSKRRVEEYRKAGKEYEAQEEEKNLEKLLRQLSMTIDDVPGNADENSNYTYKFEKWIYDGNEFYDYDLDIDIPPEDVEKEVVAVFRKTLSTNIDPDAAIEQGLRNTFRGTYLIPSYGVKTLVAVTSDGGNTYTIVDNNNHGVGYVSSSTVTNGNTVVSAKELLFTREELVDLVDFSDEVIKDGEINNENMYYSHFKKACLDLGIDENDIPAEGLTNVDDYTYKFVGWRIEGDSALHPEYNVSVSTNRDGSQKKCIAIFEKQLSIADSASKNAISQTSRNTYSTKEVYLVNCKISYQQQNDNNAVDVKTTSLTTGVYHKFYPEVFTGESEVTEDE